ncbi:MAG: hypothetical protein LBM87_07385 [Ruminococcus sp.]|jgi:hypothetical protein|nr:hypothetical protein [Ruminococcus sp.]
MAKLKKMLDTTSPQIQTLMRLIPEQSLTTVCGWALDYANEYIYPIYQNKVKPEKAVKKCLTVSKAFIDGGCNRKEKKAVREAVSDARTSINMYELPLTAEIAARCCASVAAAAYNTPTVLSLALYGGMAVAYETLGMGREQNEYDEYALTECDKMIEALKKVSVENETNPCNCVF